MGATEEGSALHRWHVCVFYVKADYHIQSSHVAMGGLQKSDVKIFFKDISVCKIYPLFSLHHTCDVNIKHRCLCNTVGCIVVSSANTI